MKCRITVCVHCTSHQWDLLTESTHSIRVTCHKIRPFRVLVTLSNILGFHKDTMQCSLERCSGESWKFHTNNISIPEYLVFVNISWPYLQRVWGHWAGSLRFYAKEQFTQVWEKSDKKYLCQRADITNFAKFQLFKGHNFRVCGAI